MAECDTVLCQDLIDLSRKSAERFRQLARESVKASERFTVALSGGSTPKHLYSLLASPDYKNQIPWSNVELFWGDERCVPPDHLESNFRMAQEALLSNIEIPAQNIHRMRGERQPQAAAAEYEKELQKFFGFNPGGLPRFDLILLGIGEDGHTASLFPGSDALAPSFILPRLTGEERGGGVAHDRPSRSHRDRVETETVRLVIAPFIEKLKSFRLTLTLPVLNNAANVWFLVAGGSKAGAVKQAFSDSSDLPAAKVQPVNGKLIWFITRDAALEIPAAGN
jgi:6-phosphogluconolactonase